MRLECDFYTMMGRDPEGKHKMLNPGKKILTLRSDTRTALAWLVVAIEELGAQAILEAGKEGCVRLCCFEARLRHCLEMKPLMLSLAKTTASASARPSTPSATGSGYHSLCALLGSLAL